MGIWDAISDIVDAVTPWSVVEAEAPAEEPKVLYHASLPNVNMNAMRSTFTLLVNIGLTTLLVSQ